MHSNLLLQTDSYKPSHAFQYPHGITCVYSYLESRSGTVFSDETVFFGLQYILHKYLAGAVISPFAIESANKFYKEHFGRSGAFNYPGWYQIFKNHNGYLPVRIRAVPEGTVVPCKNVLMTIENTDPDAPWITNFIETMLLKVWYPITVCTLSRAIKKVIKEFHIKTGCSLEGLPFKLHDFGYRGVSSEETAAIGGAAHLINFMGTDTVAGIRMLKDYYGPKEEMFGFSVPAAEHSTITAWGREHEADAYKNILHQWPEGIVAVVSDSYDLQNAVEHIWGEQLKETVVKRNGTVVIRPDSGNPRQVVLQVLEWLGEKFGFSTNQKGYRILCPKVRVIQGDGVNYFTIQDTLAAMSKAGWAAENVAFGVGGALLQQLNRDTLNFAIKCSSVTINGERQAVCKTPTGDASKRSKLGRLALVTDGTTYRTMENVTGDVDIHDHLVTVFENGEVKKDYTVPEIRKRAELL